MSDSSHPTPPTLNGAQDADFGHDASPASPAAGSASAGANRPQQSTPQGSVVFPPTRTGSGSLNPRSCVTCRRRKVRCDKQQPCSNCVRQHIPCQFPAPGRAPRRLRKPPDGELLARLRKLEGVVQSLGASADDDPGTIGAITDRGLTSDPMEIAGPSEERKRMLDYMVDHERKSLNSTFGRLVLDEGKSRYISSSFWANLSNEVEDIKTILHDDTEEEDYNEATPPLSPDVAEESFVWGHASPGHDLHLVHPPPANIEKLWKVYEENVEPVMKIFHLPTMKEQILSHKDKPGSAPRPLEAMMFSIYYAAVTSLSPEECAALTGERKIVLQPRFRHATERALARANFLRSEELMVLQALVLFISSLRRNEDPRVLWTLVGLVVRIAILMGLHRDPSLFSLSPFDTEVRRRLWWHVCNLDVRLSEDHGSDPTILEHTFDTKLPLNINDEDFQPDMPATMTDRKGITDMTFCLIRFEVANTFRRLSYQPPLTGKYHDKVHEVNVHDKSRWIEECHQSLEEKYLRYSDKNIPMHWVICTVGRLVLAKMWLSIYQPFQRLDGNACLPQQTRDQLFSTSIESIEYAMQLETEMSTVKWNWMFKSYSQWHAMAFLLNELCYRTKGPLVQRAWRAIDVMLEEWNGRIPPHKRDHIWRPLRKLVAKARAARNRELLNQKAQLQAATGAPRGNWQGEAFPMGPPWSVGNLSNWDLNGAPKKLDRNASEDASDSNSGNDMLPLTPSWAGDISSQMRAADASIATDDAEGTSDLATTPFFANQQPTQWPNFASDENSGILQDFFYGSSTFPPNMTGPRSSGLSDQRQQVPQAQQQQQQQQQPSQSTGGTIPMSTSVDNASAFGSGSFNLTGGQGPPPSDGKPGVFSAFGTRMDLGSAAVAAADPMVSGTDMGVDDDVQWDDWDSMAREYELEAGQTTSLGGTGTTPGGVGMGMGAGVNGFFGAAGPAPSNQSGVGGRRPMLGENWF